MLYLINNNNNNNNNKTVSTTTILTTNYKLLSILQNEKYRSIIYLLLTKNYTYLNEMKKFFNIQPGQYFIHLINLGIIEETELNEQRKEYLKLVHNLGNYHLDKLKVYKLTNKAKDFYSNPVYYSLIIEGISEKVRNYKHTLDEIYNSKLEAEELKRIEQEKQWEHKKKLLLRQGIQIISGDKSN